MKRQSGFGVCFFALIILTGCETGMSEQACSNADWVTLGYQDGASGSQLSALYDREADCAEFGLVADADDYKKGRLRGLEAYCDPQNGYDLGVAGGEYNGVCNGFGEASFLEAFDDGAVLYGFTSRVSRAEAALAKATNRIDRLEEKLFEHRMNFDAAEGHIYDNDKRRSALDRMDELSAELGTLERDMFDLEVERRVAQERLNEYLIDVEVESRLALERGN